MQATMRDWCAYHDRRCSVVQPSTCRFSVQVTSQALKGRLGFLGPVRGLQMLAPGVMDAPLGCATVVSLHLQGTASMQAWNSSSAAMAMQLLHDTAGHHLRKYRAYMVRRRSVGSARVAAEDSLSTVILLSHQGGGRVAVAQPQ
jgi:hypothetical protein